MADDKIRYLFVKNNMSREKSAARLQCSCSKKADNYNVKHKDKQKIERDSDMVNTAMDQEYDMIVQTLSLIVNTMKVNRNRKRRKYKVYRYCKKEILNLINSLHNNSAIISGQKVRKPHSLPAVKSRDKTFINNPKRAKSNSESQNRIRFNTDFIVNSCCKTCDVPECINPFINPLVQARVYRCQLNAQEETCCCSCNSDALFEVMKSLYDCYKKKNCDNCDCILCGHLPVAEQKGGELRKSGMGVGLTASARGRRKDKLEKAKAEGLLTPLEGKTPEQKEKILKGLAKAGLPLPEGKSPSEKKIVLKVRADMALPPEPQSDVEREKYAKALATGIITPLEGKTPAQKENILKKIAEIGIALPEGRTPSEKDLVAKIKATTAPKSSKVSSTKAPSEKVRKAKAEGLLTPLKGKTPLEKEKILKGLAKLGIPLPEGKTQSDKKIIQKIRKDMGLPPEGKSPSDKKRLAKAYAAGIITPLERKSPSEKEAIIKKMANAGVPLPEGRTPSEKNLIKKIKAETPKNPIEKLQKAKAEGLLTPIEGKSPEQKEKILNGLAKLGLPLPEGKTSSDKKLIKKVRDDIGYPAEAKTSSEKKRVAKAHAAGIITPLEGKSPAQKKAILQKMADAGVPLPEGRAPSEKSLIAKVKGGTQSLIAATPSEKLRKARAEGLLTPLDGKSPAQKENILRGLAKAGLPLPEGKTPSEKNMIQKVQNELGLPNEPKTPSEKQRIEKAYATGIITPLEGKSPERKESILRKMADAGVPLPEGRTPTEKELVAKVNAAKLALVGEVQSEKLRKAKAEGLLTPLEGKTPAQKEKILKGLAKAGLPLPEGKTPSEKKLVQKARKDMGLPVEPKTASEKRRLLKAHVAGIVTPLEGKTPSQKEGVLRRLAEAGVPLPEGRTPSEKALVDKVKASTLKTESLGKISPEKLQKAKAQGLLTPLEGKSPEQKEKILKGLAMLGLPLSEGKTPSEKKLIRKVRHDIGYPTEPATPSGKQRLANAHAAGIVAPLEGKTTPDKEAILKKLIEAAVPLPEGRTPSEKALIAKLKAVASLPSIGKLPSEKLKKAKAQGFLTPLEGKSLDQKEEILRGLAKLGLPLPEGKTPSEKKIIKKVRHDIGYPTEPKTSSEKQRLARAHAAGLVTPLKGKTKPEKEAILKKLIKVGVPLPEGRTPSEKALIVKLKAAASIPSIKKLPSEKLKKAKSQGFLTPLEGKSPNQKEKILRGLAKLGLPLPEGKTPSEKKLIQKVRTEMGYPSEPRSDSEKKRMAKAHAAGIITPLEGKKPKEKESILKKMAGAGVPLPKGRTTSEKALVDKIRKANDAGLLTPLAGKTPSEKERLLKKQAIFGGFLPLEGKTPSEKELLVKVNQDLGIPPQTSGTTIPSEKLRKARADGLLTPLDGKTKAQKDKILRGLAKAGLPLPEGKTASDKKLIHQIINDLGLPRQAKSPSEKQRIAKAHAAGVISPLEGKTHAQKESALKRMVNAGIPLPQGRTTSEKELISKVNATVPTVIPSEKLRKAKAAGLFTPLDGKTSAQKEKILKGLADAGIPFPEGKSLSEKALISKVRAELGIPPEGVTSSEKEVIRKAKANGLFTPLKGKTPQQKAMIIKGLLDAGLPVPEGKTPSENALIKKLRHEAGLPPELTASEKLGKIRKTSKKVSGEEPDKGLGVGKSEYEDIIKTTKCDRSCGCDKKKIRFKHSYVKIRVTSPDMSSLCPCPDDCIPRVKSGVIIDKEGIRVTVGAAIGVPTFSHLLRNSLKYFSSTTTSEPIYMTSTDNINELSNSYEDVYKLNCSYTGQEIVGPNNEFNRNISDIECNVSLNNLLLSHATSQVYVRSKFIVNNNMAQETMRHRGNVSDPCLDVLSNHSMSDYVASTSSVESILLLDSDSSITVSEKSRPIGSCALSVVSCFANTSRVSTKSTFNNDDEENGGIEEETFTNEIDYSSCQAGASNDVSLIIRSMSSNNHSYSRTSRHEQLSNDDVIVLRFSDKGKKRHFFKRCTQKTSETENIEDTKNTVNTRNVEPIVVINDINSCPMTPDVMKKITEILSAKPVNDDSSVFILVPTDDINNEDDSYLHPVDSSIGIQISDDRPEPTELSNPLLKPLCEIYKPKRPKLISTSRGIKFCTIGKGEKFKDKSKEQREDTQSEQEKNIIEHDKRETGTVARVESHMACRSEVRTFTNMETTTDTRDKSSERCMETMSTQAARKLQVMFDDLGFDKYVAPQQPQRRGVVAIDTTSDRPCCCQPAIQHAIASSSPGSSESCDTRRFIIQVASSPVPLDQTHTTDESHQMFSSLFKSPDSSCNKLSTQYKNPKPYVGIDKPCCCPPKNHYAEQRYSETYFSPSYYSPISQTKPSKSQIMQNMTLRKPSFSYYASSQKNIVELLNRSDDAEYLLNTSNPKLTNATQHRTFKNQKTTYCGRKCSFAVPLNATKSCDQLVPIKKEEVTELSVKNKYNKCPPVCKRTDNISSHLKQKGCQPMYTEALSNTVLVSDDQHSINQKSPKNPYKICSPTCDHTEEYGLQNEEPLFCSKPQDVNQKILKNQNIICPPMYNNADRHRAQKEESLLSAKQQAINQNIQKNPNKSCRPTCNAGRHGVQNKGTSLCAKQHTIHQTTTKYTNKICAPTCTRIWNGTVTSEQSDQLDLNCEHVKKKQKFDYGNNRSHALVATNVDCKIREKPNNKVKPTKQNLSLRNICPPTCSHTGKAPIAPFRLVPVPLTGPDAPDACDILDANKGWHGSICTPTHCGRPQSLEVLENEQKKLQLRKRLKDSMDDAWPDRESEPRGVVLVIGDDTFDEPVDCSCDTSQKKKDKRKDCACNTSKNSKRKRKCLCGDFIPPPPKIAPDLPPLPRGPSSKWTQTEESLDEKSSGSINLREQILLQTEQTQTQSGFKVSNRPNVTKDYSYHEGDLFYDDALVYFEGDIPPEVEVLFEVGPWERPPKSPESQSPSGIPDGHDACSCEDRETYLKQTMCPEEYELLRKRHKCECPLKSELPPEPSPPPESVLGLPSGLPLPPKEPMRNGLKFVIGGKGSGSKGLSGICCFDMSIDSKINAASLSDNDYIIYTD